MTKKYIAIVGIALFLFVFFAMSLIDFDDSSTSYDSLTSDSASSAKIGKHYFSFEETELVNSKIQEAD